MYKLKNIALCVLCALSMLSVAFCTTPQVVLTIDSQSFQNLSPYIREDAYKFYAAMHEPLTTWKNGGNDDIKGWSTIICYAVFVGEMSIDSSMSNQNILSIFNTLQQQRTSDTSVFIEKDEIVKVIGVLLGQRPLNFTRLNCELINSFLENFNNECQRKEIEGSNIYVFFVNQVLEYLKNLQQGDENAQNNKEELIFCALGMSQKALEILKKINIDVHRFLTNRKGDIEKECPILNLQLISKKSCFDSKKINKVLKLKNVEHLKILVERQFKVFKCQYYEFLSAEQKQDYKDLRCLLDDYFSEKKRSLINLTNLFSLYNMYVSNVLSLLPIVANWYFTNGEDKYSTKMSALLFTTSIVILFNLTFNGYILYKIFRAIMPTSSELDLCCFYSAYNKPSLVFPTQIKNLIMLFLEESKYNKGRSFFENIQSQLKGE
ncbi:MAG: hypothetical protein CNLJKLNK_00783 [Holosporales bacterium]